VSFSVAYIIKAVDKYTPSARKIAAANIRMARSFDRAKRSSVLFGRELKEVEKRTRKSFGAMGRWSRNAALVIGLPMVALGAASVKAASDMEVIYGKFDRTFSELDGADKYAKQFMKDYQVIESTAKRVLGNTGDLLVGIGFKPKLAMDMSVATSQLAADLFAANAEMTNMEDVAHRLKSGLLGETEGMKALGITINQNSKEYKKIFNEQMRVTKGNQIQAKAQTILMFALDQSKKSIGAYARGQGTLKIELYKTNQQLQRSKELIGQALTPDVIKASGKIQELAASFNKLDPSTQKTYIKLGLFVLTALVLVAVLGLLVGAFGLIAGWVFALGVGMAALIIYGEDLWNWLKKAFDLWARIPSSFNGSFSMEGTRYNAPVASSSSQSTMDVTFNDPGNMVANATVKSDNMRTNLNRGEGLAGALG
jgi:hypothetical protein